MTFKGFTNFIYDFFASGSKRKRRSSQSSHDSDGLEATVPIARKKSKGKLRVKDPKTGKLRYYVEASSDDSSEELRSSTAQKSKDRGRSGDTQDPCSSEDSEREDRSDNTEATSGVIKSKRRTNPTRFVFTKNAIILASESDAEPSIPTVKKLNSSRGKDKHRSGREPGIKTYEEFHSDTETYHSEVFSDVSSKPVQVKSYNSSNVNPPHLSKTKQKKQKAAVPGHNKPQVHNHEAGDPPLSSWTGYPDGNIALDLSHSFVAATSNLYHHWVVRTSCGRRRYGSVDADNWMQGKVKDRVCQGVIICDNPGCKVVQRAATRKSKVKRRKEKDVRQESTDEDGQSSNDDQETCDSNTSLRLCKCGGMLFHLPCGVRSSQYTWAGGVHFVNDGYHRHDRPGHEKRVLPLQAMEFEEAVTGNPRAGPSELLTGARGLNGMPGKSVSEISPAYANKDRIAADRLKIKKAQGPVLSSGFEYQPFRDFKSKHPEFILDASIKDELVISFQSAFMASQMLLEKQEDSPINGLVSDAAHGWWKDRNSLLIVSSVYCAELSCWLPVIFSYSEGGTSKHYAKHFRALFMSMYKEAKLQDIGLLDARFAGVMDFSQAEHNGFVDAFVEVHLHHKDPRTEDELVAAAERLLKGCREHFRANMTRIKRMHAVVPPEESSNFQAQVMALLNCSNKFKFKEMVQGVFYNFPAAKPWLSWYLRDSVAPMLFVSHRVMDPLIWDSIPDTTNAEEAQHWKLYCAQGRDHLFVDGVYSLLAVSKSYETLFDATSVGAKIRYGLAKRWQGKKRKARDMDRVIEKGDGRPPDTTRELINLPPKKKRKIGDTKYVNDGRPPDTAVALGVSRKSKALRAPNTGGALARQSKATGTRAVVKNLRTPLIGHASYGWNDRSCWLDSSLQLLFVAISSDSNDIRDASSTVADDSMFSELLGLFHQWENTQNQKTITEGDIRTISKARDAFRQSLAVRKLGDTTVDGENTLWSWLYAIIQSESNDEAYLSRSYFERLEVTIEECRAVGGKHVQIPKSPSRRMYNDLTKDDYFTFHGQVSTWLSSRLKFNERGPYNCFRALDHIHKCAGECFKTDLWLSLPVILIFNIDDDCLTSTPPLNWHFPAKLTPGSSYEADHGVEYDMIGRGFYSHEFQHFIARYIYRSKVYHYDGLNGGLTEEVFDVGPHQGLYSRHIKSPKGYQTSSVLYRLRGGTRAQLRYFGQTKKSLQQQLNIKTIGLQNLSVAPLLAYDMAGFSVIDSDDRLWASEKLKARTIEYEYDAGAIVDTNLMVEEVDSPATNHEHIEDVVSALDLNGPEILDDMEHSFQSSSDIGEELVLNAEESLAPDDDDDCASTDHPLSDSPFDCRCGVHGNGPELDEEGSKAIQCSSCNTWMHVACQREGRASFVSKSTSKSKLDFECDDCLYPSAQSLTTLGEFSYPAVELPQNWDRRKLSERITPGRGALIRVGEFWYPARVIVQVTKRKWKVRLWRECFLQDTSSVPVSFILDVSLGNIVDELWDDLKGRRSKRLGRWRRSFDPEKDVMFEFRDIQVPDEVNNILQPHVALLQELLQYDVQKLTDTPDSFNNVPSMAYVRSQQDSKQTKLLQGTIHQYGDLTDLQCAEIAHWFYLNVANQLDPVFWLLKVPYAHAVTIYISEKFSDQLPPGDNALDSAWTYQTTRTRPIVSGIDVDKECLSDFERRLFERSVEAGRAGSGVWGLDRGPLQDGWYPYRDLPEGWDLGEELEDREEDIQVGPSYRSPEPPSTTQDKPRPKPRPITKVGNIP